MRHCKTLFAIEIILHVTLSNVCNLYLVKCDQ